MGENISFYFVTKPVRQCGQIKIYKLTMLFNVSSSELLRKVIAEREVVESTFGYVDLLDSFCMTLRGPSTEKEVMEAIECMQENTVGFLVILQALEKMSPKTVQQAAKELMKEQELKHQEAEQVSKIPIQPTAKPNLTTKPIRGIRQLAEFLGCSPATAQKLKNRGLIPFYNIGNRVFFEPDKVNSVKGNLGRRA